MSPTVGVNNSMNMSIAIQNINRLSGTINFYNYIAENVVRADVVDTVLTNLQNNNEPGVDILMPYTQQ